MTTSNSDFSIKGDVCPLDFTNSFVIHPSGPSKEAILLFDADGKVTFKGDADEAAKDFFEKVIKLHNHHYRAQEGRIAELEAKYATLLADNAVLKGAITTHSQSVHFCEVCGKDDPCSTDDVCRVLNETPVTDALQAEMQAQGVVLFALTMRETGDDPFFDAVATACADAADKFAAQLRQEAAQ